MSVLNTVSDILKGEPARAIGYGGAAVLYVVAKLSGNIPDVTPEEALTQAAGFLAIVASFVESIRHFVYSPATVEALTDGGIS